MNINIVKLWIIFSYILCMTLIIADSNGLTVKYNERITKLEQRIEELERRLDNTMTPPAAYIKDK